jgi:hypothetical protein
MHMSLVTQNKIQFVRWGVMRAVETSRCIDPAVWSLKLPSSLLNFAYIEDNSVARKKNISPSFLQFS